MSHIKAYFATIRPYNAKKDSKIDPSLRRRLITLENNHARNKRFSLPFIPTANQILWHCSNSQSALRPKSGRSEHKLVRVCIRPNFSGSRYIRENVWEPLKLGLISGYSGLERKKGGGIANESIQLEEDRTLIENRKPPYVGTAERNIKSI